MKKFIPLLILVLSYSSYGQVIGVNLDLKSSYTATPDVGEWVPNEGFYQSISIGGVYSMEMSEKLNLEAGVSIGRIIQDTDAGVPELLGVSTIAKYYLSECFSLKGGFAFTYRMEGKNDIRKRGALSTSLGVGWDITEKFVLSTGFILPLTNSSKAEGAIRDYSVGFSLEYFFFTF